MEVTALLGQLLANGNSYTTIYLRPISSEPVTNTNNNSSDNCEDTHSKNTTSENGDDENRECDTVSNEKESDDDEERNSDENCKSTNGENAGKSRIQRVRHCREEYRCTLCPYNCTTEKAFIRHLRACESNDPQKLPLSCPICGKDRINKETLEIHMEKHKKEKHFCCDICSFRTVQLKKLIQHRRMHTGEKPHLCPFCSYRSSRRDNLRSHARRVHKKDELPCDTFTPRTIIVSPSKNKR